MDTVSQKLKHKLSLRPPPKILVEKYLIEISKNYSVPYEPDLQVSKVKFIVIIMLLHFVIVI
jgi:vacuolar protein sorting-associated protein IST1